MVEFSDLISEFAQFSAQIDGLVSAEESTSQEVDENLQICSKSLALLTEQLEFITCQLEERDKEIVLLNCKLQETTMARDNLANLIKIENKLSTNQHHELENIAEINSELEEENRNLISKINEKQSLLKHLQECEIDIDKQLRMKKELINLNHNKDAFMDLTEKYNRMKDECQSHLRIIDSLKLNVTSLEGLSEILKNLEIKNTSLFMECEKKGLLNNELKYQVEEKTRLIVRLTEKLERSTQRCKQLEEDLKNILNDDRNLRKNSNHSFSQQKGDYNRETESIELTNNNLQVTEKCQTNETDTEKGQLLINEKNTLLAQLQEADKNLRKYQHELEISRDQIRKLSSLLTENKRHYKEELTKLSMNCEKLAFENLNKDIQIEYLRSTNQTPKNCRKPSSEDQANNAKLPVQCPKIRVQSRDGSVKNSDSNSSIKSSPDSNKELNTNNSNEINKNSIIINEEESKLIINEEKSEIEQDEGGKEMKCEIEDETKEFNEDKKEIIEDKMEGVTKIIEQESSDECDLVKSGLNQKEMGEENNEELKKIDENKQEIIDRETKKKVQIDKEQIKIETKIVEEQKTMKSVGVMTDCDEKVGKFLGAEELLRNLISGLPQLSKDKSKIGSMDKKFKSIDDLRRFQGKAGHMTEQNVRDLLCEVKKFYAITIADMQKNFKAEFDKLSVTHEVALSKMKMQQLEKISQLKREHKERVDKILAAHEEEIKKINTQQQTIQSGNRSSKGLRKK